MNPPGTCEKCGVQHRPERVCYAVAFFSNPAPSADDLTIEELLADEWENLTWDRVFGLLGEFEDWKRARKARGYHTRLLDGAIAVTKELLALKKK